MASAANLKKFREIDLVLLLSYLFPEVPSARDVLFLCILWCGIDIFIPPTHKGEVFLPTKGNALQ